MSGLSRYTAFVRWPGRDYVEEIDVDAENSYEARQFAQAELDIEYEPDGEIFRVEERFGLYF